MKTDELREKYLAFFESKGCVRRPSDVLVPRWDPSVLFTPAGMNQFKDHFLGRCKLEFTRATTCQKCLRTGDIDNVGRTPYHHTFFEMLGNFSFGDYFKREAILWAWEFLTDRKWLGLDPQCLSATVYLDDDEAGRIWTGEVGLPREKVERLGEDENFWPANAPSQGPDGVCGPCSEIYCHTQHGAVEIWNLVFTQFNRVGDPPDNLRPLPSRNIDTGMGLERMASVLQGVESNFHIDILRPLVEAGAEVCAVRYDPESESGRRLRRIADHIRACTFAIHENVYPGPNKEKYVIRRLLRRAVLDAHQLGVRRPVLYQLVEVVAELMKTPYPELGETTGRVAKVIAQEEENFLSTLDAGLGRIDRVFEQMRAEKRRVVPTQEAAEMYDTHGFPPELFEAMAAEHSFTFDWEGFQQEMKRRHGGRDQPVEIFKRDPLEGIKKAMHGSRFLGYETTQVDDARVLAVIAAGHPCDRFAELGHEEPVTVVLDKTPFYGEMGGQVGDRGELAGEGLRFEVTDTQVDGAFTLHLGFLREGELCLDATVSARVDPLRRQAIRRAHSATHLLHYALRRHLGEHAQQQGSKVDADSLRFDYTHPQALDPEEIQRIEEEVNQQILAAHPIGWQNLPLAEARAAGAIMLFGEKYPDVVRMVSVGSISRELCGGTHLDNSAQVGLLKITAEESVAAGTRRIVAVTGMAALDYAQRTETALRRVAGQLRVPLDEVLPRVEAMAREIRQLKKRLAQGVKPESVGIDRLLDEAEEVAGTRVVVAELPGTGAPAMRQLIDQLRRRAAPVAVLLASRQDDQKVLIIAGLSRDLVEQGLSAVDWVRQAARAVDGGGGGRPDLAQAGGKRPAHLPQALKTARERIREMLAAGQ